MDTFMMQCVLYLRHFYFIRIEYKIECTHFAYFQCQNQKDDGNEKENLFTAHYFGE